MTIYEFATLQRDGDDPNSAEQEMYHYKSNELLVEEMGMTSRLNFFSLPCEYEKTYALNIFFKIFWPFSWFECSEWQSFHPDIWTKLFFR